VPACQSRERRAANHTGSAFGNEPERAEPRAGAHQRAAQAPAIARWSITATVADQFGNSERVVAIVKRLPVQ